MAELKGAEIFSVGTWNGLEFSEDDLRAIERSFHELSLAGRVPLKLGHNDDQPMTDGKPSLGWVDRVWLEGGKLLADFTNVPRVLYEAVRDKLYNFVSVELLQDAERNGASYPWVLSGVALLGSDLPAVTNLAELSRLTMSRRARLQFRRAGTLTFNGEGNRMADELEALRAQIRQLEDQVRTFSNENAGLARERDEAVKQRKQEKADAIKREVEARFEAEIEAKRLLPSARERYFKWTFPKDLDAIVEFDPKDADTYITENRVTMSETPTKGKGKTEANDEDGMRPDEVVAQRVRLFCSENEGVSYKDAMVEVLRADPTLADEYRYMPDTHYSAK